MNDFETHPIGTTKRLELLIAAVEDAVDELQNVATANMKSANIINQVKTVLSLVVVKVKSE